MREWGKLKKGTPVVRVDGVNWEKKDPVVCVDGVNWKKEHPSYA